ncbi:hypothetical protein [Treponema lecithinolyticum]|uniref:hypothetical protein n=1 Tax=Treponema lecithinolyticum TaxID=53418 RepID=UPI0028EC26C5|nr:hypothetical protein [Treponema lecithinolyticum]
MNEEELTFYYNREKRLERAPENVKRFYNGTAPTAPKGLFKALVHTKHSRFMLAAVGISLAVVVLTTLFGAKSNQKNINGVRLVLSAFSFDDSVYVTLRAFGNPDAGGKAEQNGIPADGKVEQEQGSVAAGSAAVQGGTLSGAEAEALTVKADFTGCGKDGGVLVEKKIQSVYDGKENFYRTIFTDYDIVSVQADVSINGERTLLKTAVQRK